MELKARLLTRRFRNSVFCGREELLSLYYLTCTITFIKQEKKKKKTHWVSFEVVWITTATFYMIRIIFSIIARYCCNIIKRGNLPFLSVFVKAEVKASHLPSLFMPFLSHRRWKETLKASS